MREYQDLTNTINDLLEDEYLLKLFAYLFTDLEENFTFGEHFVDPDEFCITNFFINKI